MKFSFSLDAAIFLTLTTVFFYTSGQIYLNGYLSPFLVDSIVLNFSVQDKIYIGFLKSINEYLYILAACLIMFFIRYIFIYFELGSVIEKKIANLIPINERPKKNVLRIHNSEYFEGLDRNYAAVLLTTFLSLALAWGVLQAFIHIEKKGKEISAKVMRDVGALPTVKSNGQELFLIKCGSSLCALIDEKKNVSFVEPKNIVLLGGNFKDK
ncbi:hypothetical protein J559_1284 [Acinetobacter sp. 983759]|uniref:hypothetical protein n=1 Tax=Acinetobacter sp. 983759 TaxID=1310660 RepID=UPI000452A1EC|nr:hypothetical protein [Acinetobacter sp. 983759]EXE14530.1 hypothetical protein J559_1284 [Acinetobacter sp. 983759]